MKGTITYSSKLVVECGMIGVHYCHNIDGKTINNILYIR